MFVLNKHLEYEIFENHNGKTITVNVRKENVAKVVPVLGS